MGVDRIALLGPAPPDRGGIARETAPMLISACVPIQAVSPAASSRPAYTICLSLPFPVVTGLSRLPTAAGIWSVCSARSPLPRPPPESRPVMGAPPIRPCSLVRCTASSKPSSAAIVESPVETPAPRLQIAPGNSSIAARRTITFRGPNGPAHQLANATPYLFDEQALARAVEGIERLA